MSLDRDEIARRIPHQGAMCLLAAVERWDAEAVRCRADSHRDPANPLRDAHSLPAAAGIEYAAQAMAVHGALVAPPDSTPQMGFLASVRGVDVRCARLDTVAADLEIEARRLSGDERNVLYEFSIHAGGELLLSGRAAVILDAGGLAAPLSGVSR